MPCFKFIREICKKKFPV